MKKRKLLFTLLALSLGCLSGGSGAMAQNGWEAIYTQTQTTSDDWNPLASDQTEGYTLGATGTTKYYYLKKSLSFTNSTAGGSGLKIQGTVYLYLPAGISITCQGANASGQTGAGAGIELPSGNTLYIIGGGTGTTVTATGGNAANGSNGGNGTNAGFDEQADKVWPGAGGQGGYGGGGAGAGIGSRGANGGDGGAGGDGPVYSESSKHDGIAGSAGGTGGTATAMGNLYVDQTYGITVNATGGSQASTGGTGGNGGSNILRDGGTNDSMAGGAGGGGGGFGGAASNIGTGGCGGGGGGGGAGGSVAYAYSTVYSVGANGGHPGANGNGTFNTTSGFGASTLMAAGTVVDHEGDNMTCEGWENNVDNRGAGGNSGDRGNNALNGTQNTGKKEYNITYNPLKTKVNGSNTNPVTVTYSPSGATNVVLPQNKDGYQWVLLTYGKSCAPNGTPDSQFATATTNYFGGHVSEAERTIILSNVYGDLLFQEIATMCKIANSGNNDQDIAEFQTAQYPITVRLKDRTLYRDEHWNTICLPFDLTAAQYNDPYCPLKGATIFKMDESTTGYYPNGVDSYDYPVILLWFENAEPSTNGLQAGKPYLVKWTEGNQFTIDGNHVDNTAEKAGDPSITARHELDFENVTITTSTPSNWTSHANTYGNVVFQGTFSSSATIQAGNKTRLLLGANDYLYYPSKNINVSACRGYFIIPENAALGARQYVMGFEGENGEVTSIKTINVTHDGLENDAPVYNLNGQRLSAPQKGINIINGKRILVK